MKKSELKEMIKNAMLDEGGKYYEDGMDEGGKYYEDKVDEADASNLEEEKEVDVEDNEKIDVDIEKDVKVDDVEKESDIEVKSEVPGESEDVAAVLGLLTKAQAEAEVLGDEKLMDQIGNTITYYTRAHVVTSTNESTGDEVDQDSVVDVSVDNPATDAEIGMALDESISRFSKLAGLTK